MPKYARLHNAVLQSQIPEIELSPSVSASANQILSVHSSEYFSNVLNGTLTERELHRIGFPWSPALVTRSFHTVGGTIDTCRAALQDGIAANLAGGTHHAYPDHGEGYCVFNDVAIAARVMQAEGRVERVLIIDCDVHQGNGTAAIFANDQTVFTFSVHGQKNFPYHKEIGDLDIALPDGSGDEEFLSAVKRGVEEAFLKARADLAIYIAGADPYVDDRLGRLAMSKQGLAERDRWVINFCKSQHLPVAIVMGGGYARDMEDVVGIHLQTVRIAVELSLIEPAKNPPLTTQPATFSKGYRNEY